MQEQYINSEIYNIAVSDLEAIARSFDPAAPDDLRTRLVEVLGDLGVWPMTAITGADDGKVLYAA